jgi:hypothetical protein
MLRWLSSCGWKFGIVDVLPGESLVDRAGQVAFQAAQDVFGRQLFSGAAISVGAGRGVGGEPGAGDHAQGAVGLAVAATGEPMPFRLAAGCRDRCDPAEGGKGRLGADPVGVVADGDEQLCGGLVADTVDGDQRRACPFDEGPQLAVEVGDFGGQGVVAARRGAQREADSDLWVGAVAGGPQPRAGGDQCGRVKLSPRIRSRRSAGAVTNSARSSFTAAVRAWSSGQPCEKAGALRRGARALETC